MNKDIWKLPLRCCPIILTAQEFNEWIFLIDAAVSMKDHSFLTEEQVKELENMKDEMLNYSQFDRKNQYAEVRLAICELSAFQAVITSMPYGYKDTYRKNYFSEAAEDPDSRQFQTDTQ